MTGSESFTIMPSEPPAPGTDDRKGLMEFGSLTRALQGGLDGRVNCLLCWGTSDLEMKTLYVSSQQSLLCTVLLCFRGVLDLFKGYMICSRIL